MPNPRLQVWEIVTGGRVPFQERDDRAVRQAVLAANGNLLAVPPRCPPALRTVMERCWSRYAATSTSFSDHFSHCCPLPPRPVEPPTHQPTHPPMLACVIMLIGC